MRRILFMLGMMIVWNGEAHAEALFGVPAGAAVAAAAQARQAQPVITGDRRGVHTTTRHRELTVTRTITRDRGIVIQLMVQGDVVAVSVGPDASVHVTRAGHTIAVSSFEAFEAAQDLLAGSRAVLSARALLSARENTSDLQAPEMALLSSLAFVASLVGDSDAPRRLASRYVEKYRGIFRQIRLRSCWDTYESSVSGAWNDMQQCMKEADQDDSWLRAAYRRIACNAIWALESESAWFELLKCTGTAPKTD